VDLRNVVVGLAAGVIVALLAALAVKAPPGRGGWRRITPAAMHWIGVGLGGGLVLLMSYVRLFVGSARPDAERQMTILSWLIVAFAVGTIAVALAMVVIRRQAVQWRGDRIVYRRGWREVERDLEDVVGITTNLVGQVVLHFSDGAVLRLDPYAQGSAELVETIHERLEGA
jgi:hypothetical protein